MSNASAINNWFNIYFPFLGLDSMTGKKLAKYENNIEFQNTFMNLINLYLYSFSFKNLPKSCNERYFKLMLLMYGKVFLGYNDMYGYTTLPGASISADYNLYGEPTKVQCTGWGGQMFEYRCYQYGTDNDNVDAVMCRENAYCYPLINTLIMYAKRMSDCIRSIDVCAKKLKVPYFITCDESQKASVKQIINDVDFNTDSIIASKAMTPNSFQVLQTGVNPQALSTLWAHYSNLQSEIRTILGINNASNLDKKERLVVDEVQANDVLTDLQLATRMEYYQQFADTANRVFGLDIEVVNNIETVEVLSEAKYETDTSRNGTETESE